MNQKLVEEDLSYKIIQAAFEVHNNLGPGFLESIYEQAMIIELKNNGLDVEAQKSVDVFYKEYKIGHHIIDIVVNNKVIVELKALSGLAPIHKQQTLSYLMATNMPLALLLNFGSPSVEIARIVNTKLHHNNKSVKSIHLRNPR